MTPDREQEIGSLDLLELMPETSAPIISGHLAAMQAEIARLRKALSDAADQVAERDDDLGKASAHTHFLEHTTLPELRREIERHRDGKARWRRRAEKAEARVAELEAALADATEPDVNGAGRTYQEYNPGSRDLHPGAEAARRMLRKRQDAEETP